MKTKTIVLLLLGCTFFGVGLVSVLFLMSEEKMQRNNAFQRRYVHHPVTKLSEMDLMYNSYYIAGVSDSDYYLGNVTAPMHVLQVSKSLEDTLHLRLRPEGLDCYDFRNLRVIVQAPAFYLSDGTVPIIYKGSLDSLAAFPIMYMEAYFSKIVLAGFEKFGIRTMSSTSLKSVLGILTVADSTEVILNDKLLTAQIDGIFDTDGDFIYNDALEQLIYVYYYRNSYLQLDKDLNLIRTGRTIDTVSQAKLNIKSYSATNQSKLGGTPLIINKKSATYGNYLFIHSERPGKYEDVEVLKHASIIDVYDLTTNSYKFSFYLYHVNKNRLMDFKVFGNTLIAIVDEYLFTYYLKENYFDLL